MINTDNIHMLAVLALDIRPSSICVHKVNNQTFDIEVMRSESLDPMFDHRVRRLAHVIERRFEGTNLGAITFNIQVVDKLKHRFEEQTAWKLATQRVQVGR